MDTYSQAGNNLPSKQQCLVTHLKETVARLCADLQQQQAQPFGDPGGLGL